MDNQKTPKNFDLKLGFTCNNDCVHCVVSTKRKLFRETDGVEDLSTDSVKEIIDNIESDVDYVTITGGEPSIREDFEEIVNYIYDSGFGVHIQTNGTGLYDDKLVERISNKLGHVLLAIHSFDEEIHNKIVNDKTGTMYKKTMKAFKNLVRFNIPCSTQTVISEYNVDVLYDTYKKIQEFKPGIAMHMTYAHGLGNAWKNKDKVLLKYSDIRESIIKSIKHFGRHIITEAIPKCYLYPFQDDLLWNSDDKVFVRNRSSGIDPSNKSLANGDDSLIKEGGYMEDYSVADMKSKKKARKCLECVFFDRCPGPWEEYIDLYKNELDLFPITGKAGTVILRNYEPCMSTCLFCNGSKVSKEKYDLEIFKQKVDYFIENEYSAIEISGEPCENENIIEAVRYIHENGVNDIQLSTHARTFKDPTLAKEVADAGVTRLRVPLYGSSKEIHEKTTWSKNGEGSPFDDTIQAIKNMANEDVKICGQILINRYNRDDINNIFDLYVELVGRDTMLLREVALNFTGISVLDYEYTDGWYLPIKDYGEIVDSYIRHTKRYHSRGLVNCPVLEIPYCTIGRYDEQIMNYNKYPDIGNQKLDRKSSSKNDKVPDYREKAHFEECKNCKLNNICAGLPVNEMKMFGHYGLKAIN